MVSLRRSLQAWSLGAQCERRRKVLPSGVRYRIATTASEGSLLSILCVHVVCMWCSHGHIVIYDHAHELQGILSHLPFPWFMTEGVQKLVQVAASCRCDLNLFLLGHASLHRHSPDPSHVHDGAITTDNVSDAEAQKV